jgi:hypothetical protein
MGRKEIPLVISDVLSIIHRKLRKGPRKTTKASWKILAFSPRLVIPIMKKIVHVQRN